MIKQTGEEVRPVTAGFLSGYQGQVAEGFGTLGGTLRPAAGIFGF